MRRSLVLFNMNPYNVLGVSSSSTTQEVRAQYMKLVKKWHPDVNKNPGAQKKFQEIQEAFDMIKNHGRTMNDSASHAWDHRRTHYRRTNWQQYGGSYNQHARDEWARQKREEEDRRFAYLPPWKRALYRVMTDGKANVMFFGTLLISAIAFRVYFSSKLGDRHQAATDDGSAFNAKRRQDPRTMQVIMSSEERRKQRVRRGQLKKARDESFADLADAGNKRWLKEKKSGSKQPKSTTTSNEPISKTQTEEASEPATSGMKKGRRKQGFRTAEERAAAEWHPSASTKELLEAKDKQNNLAAFKTFTPK